MIAFALLIFGFLFMSGAAVRRHRSGTPAWGLMWFGILLWVVGVYMIGNDVGAWT